MKKIKLIQNIIGNQNCPQLFGEMEDLLKDIKAVKGKWYKQFGNKKKKGKIKKNC